jgi:hypothetical protein
VIVNCDLVYTRYQQYDLVKMWRGNGFNNRGWEGSCELDYYNEENLLNISGAAMTGIIVDWQIALRKLESRRIVRNNTNCIFIE